ncbi:uncharacterized protein JCM15063_006323 [Sporobolomyces koalae]|uniref:uncharacterized protein n=1 Tax=Sporobolomyces koalae TaxID=500713 RepID=UPI003174C4CA
MGRRNPLEPDPPSERQQTPLEHYLSSTKPQAPPSATKPRIRQPAKYSSLAEATKHVQSKSVIEGGNKLLNKAIRNTLGKEDNPVTNSTSYERTMHVQSCATGHQGGGGGRNWSLHRNAKLAIQAAEKESDTLSGVIAYISGYTGKDVTNLQLKACVERQGGKVLTMASGKCTHIFSTSNLSGSKAQKFIESNKKNKVKLVLPEWAYECEKLGKRISEIRYVAPIKHENQESIFEIYGSTSTSTSASSLLTGPSSHTTIKKDARDVPSLIKKDEVPIVLSPSPSPKSPRTKKQKVVRSSSTIHRKVVITPTKKSPEKTKMSKEKEKKAIEELLILGSSDVEVEDKALDKKLSAAARPSKEITSVKSSQDASEDKLDEFGMPPSAQRR